uniref:Cwf15/Cwc15 cell cycle control protein n=1 Tax=Tetraselmis chuii TaxID=63592 RepID=A0A7S1SNE1_9CHLO|mmetsp:Transcript_21277/g.37883  ORF Transcript_21277/g.37883 Transcript_21277/m.37883 type:complete len:224 (+) Transcript_21277:216-887(+)
MTTAHRPTWAPAMGHEEQGGMRIFAASTAHSAKDQAGQTKMKFRKIGQGAKGELKDRDLKAELEMKEAKHLRDKFDFEEEKQEDLKLLESGGDGGGRPKMLVPKAIDADESDDEEESDSDDDDSDDEAELLAELERIKKERAEEEARKAAEEASKAEQEKEEELRRGNPLLHGTDASFGVKRRWDDDVVFKNQARGEPKAQRRFINDTIRSDFHRRFLNRYIK